MNKSIYSFLVVFMLLGGSLFAQNKPTSVDNVLGQLGFGLPTAEIKVPEFSLNDLDGKEMNITDLEGKVVFLNFWATWCPPCRAEMPSMEKVYNKYKDQNFTMIAVNLREDKNTIMEFLEKEGYSFPVWMDKDGAIGSGMFGVSGIPTTFIIDKKGLLRGRLVGTREWDVPEFHELLDLLIQE